MNSFNEDALPSWMTSGEFPIAPLSEEDIAWLLATEASEFGNQNTISRMTDMYRTDTPQGVIFTPNSGANFSAPAILPVYAPPSNESFYYPQNSGSSGSAQMHSHSHSTSEEWDRSGSPTKTFSCTICRKVFSRKSRAQACENNHRGIKEFLCGGRCGDPSCNRAYVSSTSLARHCLPQDKRYITCDFCGMNFTKQNITRHSRSCSASSPNSNR